MTTYRLFPSTNGPANVTGTSGGWLLGVQFSVTTGLMWLQGYWHWVPSNGDTTARKFALWNVYASSTEQVVPSSTVTSGIMITGQWNFAALPTPIQLAPGTQYVAATGWPVSNGIPITSNQFDSGQPFAAGIVNGPLTAWSASTGSNGYPNPYGIGGQMLFSNSLGDDPGLAMPNNGSSSDNLWVDVQISDTAPGGYGGSYRFWPNAYDLGNYGNDTANNFTLGTQFSVSQTCAINNVWFYSPAGVSQLPTGTGVFDADTTTLVYSDDSPSWSGIAGSGWMSSALSGTLQPGVNYKVAVVNGAGTPAIWNGFVAGYWSTGFGGAGLTAGPLSAPDNASALSPGQETYNAGASLTYPATSVGPYHYGVDIEVTPQAAPPAAPPVLYQMRMMP